jgi:hypothetical protein
VPRQLYQHYNSKDHLTTSEKYNRYIQRTIQSWSGHQKHCSQPVALPETLLTGITQLSNLWSTFNRKNDLLNHGKTYVLRKIIVPSEKYIC